MGYAIICFFGGNIYLCADGVAFHCHQAIFSFPAPFFGKTGDSVWNKLSFLNNVSLSFADWCDPDQDSAAVSRKIPETGAGFDTSSYTRLVRTAFD